MVYGTRGVVSQAWPDFSRLRNSQETLESSIYTLCTATIVAVQSDCRTVTKNVVMI